MAALVLMHVLEELFPLMCFHAVPGESRAGGGPGARTHTGLMEALSPVLLKQAPPSRLGMLRGRAPAPAEVPLLSPSPFLAELSCPSRHSGVLWDAYHAPLLRELCRVTLSTACRTVAVPGMPAFLSLHL